MSTNDIYSISQIAASIAVVITLILVILQLRQANRSHRTDTHQVLLRRGFDMFQVLADPTHAALIVKASRDDADLSSEDVYRLYLLTRMVVINFQDLTWQRRIGAMEHDIIRDAMAGTQAWFAMPGVRICWAMSRYAYLRDVAEMIEQTFIKDMPVAPADYAAQWKEAAVAFRATSRKS
jgi:hypothetical protein